MWVVVAVVDGGGVVGVVGWGGEGGRCIRCYPRPTSWMICSRVLLVVLM